MTLAKLAGIVAILVLVAPLASAAADDETASTPKLPSIDLTPVANAGAAAGHAIADGASSTGHALASVASAIGAGIASAAAAAASAIAAAGALVGALLARGARAAIEHPRETVIVAGSATGLALVAALLKRFGGLLFLPLYTRLAPSQMLDNDARNRVFEHVKANPGAHPSGIADALKLGWGTVIYHLGRLESSKLVVPKTAHNRKCYFVIGSDLDAQGRAVVAAIAHDKAKLIVQAVQDAPGISQKQLAERVGMSQALASWHVKRLVESGVLRTERAGRSHALRVADHVPRATTIALAPVAAAV